MLVEEGVLGHLPDLGARAQLLGQRDSGGGTCRMLKMPAHDPKSSGTSVFTSFLLKYQVVIKVTFLNGLMGLNSGAQSKHYDSYSPLAGPPETDQVQPYLCKLMCPVLNRDDPMFPLLKKKTTPQRVPEAPLHRGQAHLL